MGKNKWPTCVTEDLLQQVARQASNNYDPTADDPGLFTSAGFSRVFCDRTGYKAPLDGGIVRAILLGRWWIEPQASGNYWRIVEDPADCQECDRYLDEQLRQEVAFERNCTAVATEETRDHYQQQRDEATTKVHELGNILADYQDQDTTRVTTQEYAVATARIAQLEQEHRALSEAYKDQRDEQLRQYDAWAANETRQLREIKQKLEELTLGMPSCFEDLVREIKRLRAAPRDLAIPEYRTMLQEARQQRDEALNEIRWVVGFDQLKHKTGRERLQNFVATQAEQQDDDPEVQF